MKSNYIILISAIILSLALIFSALYLGHTITSISFALIYKGPQAVESLLMDADRAAAYIGISTDTLVDKIKKEKVEKRSLSSYEVYRFIPYLELDGVMYFTKSELDKWAEYNTMHQY